jgi:mono/diheme cytochrome c family protein
LSGLFKNPRLPDSGLTTDEKTVREQILNGGKKMPPFRHLKKEQITAIIEYLKSL